MAPLLSDPDLKPAPADIAANGNRADELLQIRRSTPLFNLGTRTLVEQKLSFPNGGPDQTPGVITMRIDDTKGRDFDSRLKGVVVVFNAGTTTTTQTVSSTAGRRFALHPVQGHGGDAVVQKSTYNYRTGSFTVSARTVAVFVQR